MKTIIHIIGAVALFLGIAVVGAVLAALPVYLLWNWLMPDLFHLPTITFWQALGVALLSGILFKSNGSKNKD